MKLAQHVSTMNMTTVGSLVSATVSMGTSYRHNFVIKDIAVEGDENLTEIGLLKKLEALNNEPVNIYHSFEEALDHLNNLKRS